MALISFDLDGVLIRNPFHSGRPDGVFGHIRKELAPFTGLTGPEAEKAALRMVLEEHRSRLQAGDILACYDWDDIVATVGRRIGYTGRMDIASLVARYAQNPELCYSYPGAAACLQALTDAGHILVAVTNGFSRYQEPVLRQLGLLGYFRTMICPDTVGAAKPDRSIFEAAAACGGPPRIHVGDTLPHDMAGARQAGWKTIYLQQPEAPGSTEIPKELAALPPDQRPARASEWLRSRLELERRYYPWPPVMMEECMPDAIAFSLAEVPEAVAALIP